MIHAYEARLITDTGTLFLDEVSDLSASATAPVQGLLKMMSRLGVTG